MECGDLRESLGRSHDRKGGGVKVFLLKNKKITSGIVPQKSRAQKIIFFFSMLLFSERC